MGNVITNYDGQVQNGLRHGKGIQYRDQNMKIKIYEGEFLNDKYHGHGKLYDEYGTLYYDGFFTFGKLDGKGKLYDTHASRIHKTDILSREGTWTKGSPNGFFNIYDSQGVLTLKCVIKGVKYTGKFMLFHNSYIIKGVMDNKSMRNSSIYFKNGDILRGNINLTIEDFELLPSESFMRDYVTMKKLKNRSSEENLFEKYNQQFRCDDLLGIEQGF